MAEQNIGAVPQGHTRPTTPLVRPEVAKRVSDTIPSTGVPGAPTIQGNRYSQRGVRIVWVAMWAYPALLLGPIALFYSKVDHVASRAAMLGVAAVCMTLSICGARAFTVVISGAGIRYRSLVKTYRFGWDRVVAVRLNRYAGSRGYARAAVEAPELVLRDAPYAFLMQELNLPVAEHARSQAVVDWLNAHLAAATRP